MTFRALASLGLTEVTATNAAVTLNGNRRLKFEYLGSESDEFNTFTAGSIAPFDENDMGAGVGTFTLVLIGIGNFSAEALSNVSFHSSANVNSFIGDERFGIL